MHSRSSNRTEGPFPREHDEPEEDIDDLKDRNRFYGSIEVFGEEIPEDLGPKDTVNTSYELV
jgi:hypothetical protein